MREDEERVGLRLLGAFWAMLIDRRVVYGEGPFLKSVSPGVWWERQGLNDLTESAAIKTLESGTFIVFWFIFCWSSMSVS